MEGGAEGKRLLFHTLQIRESALRIRIERARVEGNGALLRIVFVGRRRLLNLFGFANVVQAKI